MFNRKKNITLPKVATKWEEVSLKQYDELVDYIATPETDSITNSVKIYGILSDEKNTDKILSMPVTELEKELDKIRFIAEPYKVRTPEESYVIDGKEYEVDLNIKHLTAAAFIDYQNFIKDLKNNLKFIYLCFLKPKGCKYNEGYDVMEVAEELYDKIPVTIVLDIFGFFQNLSRVLLTNTAHSLAVKIQRMMKKEKNPQKRMELQKVLEELKDMDGLSQCMDYLNS